MKHSKTLDPDELFNQSWRHEEKGDLASAFKCLLAGARLGHTSCQINLGNYYSDGTAVQPNLKRAAYWYRVAYKNGDRCAAANMAIEHRKAGRQRAAVLWFKRAVALEDGDACVELAKMYMTRKGGEKLATPLLEQALLMRRRDITEYGKEEAKALLNEIGSKESNASSAAR